MNIPQAAKNIAGLSESTGVTVEDILNALLADELITHQQSMAIEDAVDEISD